ncbi:MAG TPA: nicotinate-nucleotide adenylyltransferase [Burkholderiales bacterium]|nr:nicotinate-nucleotide adenylyltransferase [Burkholderiales bacterium]
MASGAVGILGGTFDPVHNAHLRIAQLALDVLALGQVLWIPTGAPGYRNAPVAPASDRVAMLELAIRGEPRYAIDRRELAPGASGYTVDTLRALRAERGAPAELVLLMGDDQFEKLETWHQWRELFALARIAVFARPGWAPQASAAVRAAGAVERVDMPPLDISSTVIRERVARGEDIARLVPPQVLQYISSHRLYR